jgi:Lar family restriction alleviation protein
MDAELRPCPFCGGTNLETMCIRHTRLNFWYVVECKRCYARGPVYYLGRLESDDGKAAELWQKRVSECADCTGLGTVEELCRTESVASGWAEDVVGFTQGVE